MKQLCVSWSKYLWAHFMEQWGVYVFDVLFWLLLSRAYTKMSSRPVKKRRRVDIIASQKHDLCLFIEQKAKSIQLDTLAYSLVSCPKDGNDVCVQSLPNMRLCGVRYTHSSPMLQHEDCLLAMTWWARNQVQGLRVPTNLTVWLAQWCQIKQAYHYNIIIVYRCHLFCARSLIFI